MPTPGAPREDRVDGRRPSPITLLIVAAFLVVAAVAATAVAVLISNYEVLEKGQLLPYTEGKIYKIGLGDSLTFYVEPERRPDSDLLVAYLLTGTAFAALTFGIVLWSGGRRGGIVPAFFWITFVGVSFLVADETLGIHESIGHNLQFLLSLPLIKRPDDAVMLLMLATIGLVVYYFRRVVLASRAATWLVLASVACMLFAVLADVLDLPFEELLETMGALCTLAGVIALGLHHTGSIR